MVGLIEKLKTHLEMWRIEKYTKRRAFLPEYESRDKDYYEQCYRDGVYYSPDSAPPKTASDRLRNAPSFATKRASTLLRRQSRRPNTPPRCSETYNANYER
ncbi:hypothetical protein BJV82DRAFT_632997 [Fennellomyces sp. T-0311]|nr:hypothetical protein BJV82DRAFT_632997 [Fennellomyces sp. T-0311]